MHPDDEKLDQDYAAMTENRRRGQRSTTVELSLVAVATVLITASTVFSAWNVFELRKLAQEEVKTRETILLGTECIVEQLAEHRHLNALGHRADAAHQGYSYPISPEEEPPPTVGQLERSCGMFIHTTTTSSTTR